MTFVSFLHSTSNQTHVSSMLLGEVQLAMQILTIEFLNNYNLNTDIKPLRV